MKVLLTYVIARALLVTPEGDPSEAAAQSALQAARTATASRKSVPVLAKEKLSLAESFCKEGKYKECAAAADEAWKLSAKESADSSHFAVEVAKDGSTHVRAKSGKPVQVAAQGVSRPVYAGQAVAVAQGKPPASPVEIPGVPHLKTPASEERLRLKPSKKGLGPVTLAWDAVNGASSYEVVLEGSEQPLQLASPKARVQLPYLPAGTYRWAVRAVGASDIKSDLSEKRAFELIEDPLKLEVKGGDWK
jgi:hypothetical protein